MALWSVTFLGSTPVGGPVIGVVSEHFEPRAGLALGAGACLAAAVLGLLALPGVPQQDRFVEPTTARRQPPPAVSETDRA